VVSLGIEINDLEWPLRTLLHCTRPSQNPPREFE